MSTRFTLGQKVTFSHMVTKVHPDGKTTTWERTSPPVMRESGKEESTPTEGVIVGQRFLSDYAISVETEYEDAFFGGGGSYTMALAKSGTSRKAWLVSYHLRRKPILVLDDDVQPQ